MEEDIKILEEFIEAYRIAEEVLDGDVINAIENLITRNKELEVEIFVYKNNLADYTRKVVNEVFGNEYISKLKLKEKIEEIKNGTYDAKIILQQLLEES